MTESRLLCLWRYPVKSMQGEQITRSWVAEDGILGDRAYALFDHESGTVASAKHARLWGRLLQCQAQFMTEPQPNAPLPPVQITLPDTTTLTSDHPHIHEWLSRYVERPVSLIRLAPAQALREANRSPFETDEHVQQEPLALAAPQGTFFDYAPIHLLSTATLHWLHTLYPGGNFDLRRFRPNLVLEVAPEAGAVELTWLGSSIAVGSDVQLQLIDPCPRCVVTTLPQAELPPDLGILRTLGDHAHATSVSLAPGREFTAVAGVYAQVLRAGMITVHAGVDVL